MEAHQHHPATDSNPEGVCPVHGIAFAGLKDAVSETRDTVLRIEDSLKAGGREFENLSVRMDHVERCVYGALGAAGLALIGAIVALVVKGGN